MGPKSFNSLVCSGMKAKMIYHDKKMIKHFFVILQQCNSASKHLWWNGSLGPKAA